MPDARNLGLLIPGTASTALYDEQGRDLGHPVDADTASGLGGLLGQGPDEMIDTLAMEHRPGQWAPVRTSLVPGRSLLPGYVFEESFYSQVPEDYVHFHYDWRADLRYNAERLLRFMETRKRPDQRWNVVAHSQGGLLVVLASKMLDDPAAFAELAHSVSLVGVPFAGTLPAAASLLTGDPIGKAADSALDGLIRATRALFDADGATDDVSDMREAMRTWPALYQMLPTWGGVVDPDGSPAGTSLLDPAVWSGHQGISADLLSRAEETQEMLRQPLAHLQGPIRIRTILAHNRSTPVAFICRDGTLTSEAGAHERGDSAVPYDLTRSHVLSTELHEVVGLDDECEPHEYLLRDERVWRHARVEEPDPTEA